MNLDEALKSVAILGAGGKMGRGIAEIILLQMARLEAIELGAVNGTRRRLTLVETDEAAMDGLRNHLKTSLKKFAERNIIALKKWFEKSHKCRVAVAVHGSCHPEDAGLRFPPSFSHNIPCGKSASDRE